MDSVELGYHSNTRALELAIRAIEAGVAGWSCNDQTVLEVAAKFRDFIYGYDQAKTGSPKILQGV